MKNKYWTREELILAFNLYCKIPFGTFHNRNPKIIELAELIGRTPSALALKLTNFASFDPYHKARGVKGMRNAGRLDKEVWDEFTHNWDDLIFESEQILATKQKTTIEKKYKPTLEDIADKKGEYRESKIKARVNQDFFRKVILSIYNNKCAISGIDIPDLLIASHIMPWAKHEKERLDPHNGICLSPLYDKCFDKGYIGITPDYMVIVSEELKGNLHQDYYKRYFTGIENNKINLPDRFLPQPEFLDHHYRKVFLK